MHHILVVEDEAGVAEFISKFLKTRGYEVLLAGNGKDALKTLREEAVDLAIVDLILPDMNGYDLCAMIRHDQAFGRLPIIISTGTADQMTREMSQNFGVSGFLDKPYRASELLDTVCRALAGTNGNGNGSGHANENGNRS